MAGPTDGGPPSSMRSYAGWARSPLSPLGAREQRQRVLDASVEHLVCEFLVGERPGELQGADQQGEQAERLPASRPRISRNQADRDLVDQSQDSVGVGVLGCIAAPPELVEQGRR